MTLSPATKIGPYEIQAPLGSGGMGEVYRAHDSALKRDVAIKVLPTFVSSDPDRLRRFEQEARALATAPTRPWGSLFLQTANGSYIRGLTHSRVTS